MINVAFICNFQKESVNGVLSAINSLAEGLKKKGVKVFFYGVSDKTSTYSDEEGFVYRSFKKGALPFSLPPDLYKILKENPDQIDVFHFHSVFIPFFIPVQKALVSKGYPYVLTPHGGYDQGILNKNKLIKWLYINLLERKLVKKSAKVICVSKNEVHDVQRITKHVSTEVVYNAVGSKESKKSPIQLESDIKTVVYLGRFDILHKGLDKLLYIFKEIQKKEPFIHLKLYGEGKDKYTLLSLIKSLNIRNVSIFEPVYGLEKDEALSKATAYIQVSNWEVFGISIVEAMLKSKPVILSSSCVLSNLLIQSNAGLVIENNDFEKAAQSIVDYLKQESRMTADGKILQKLAASKFSIEVIAEKTLDLYLKVLNRTTLTDHTKDSLIKIKA